VAVLPDGARAAGTLRRELLRISRNRDGALEVAGRSWAGVYLRADPKDMSILDGRDDRQRAELIAERLRGLEVDHERLSRSGIPLSTPYCAARVTATGSPRAGVRLLSMLKAPAPLPRTINSPPPMARFLRKLAISICCC
jgi:hypothetical protein